MNKQRIIMNALAQKLRLININPTTLTVDNITKNVRLYSSIAGFVSKVNVNIGNYVNPSDVLFELIDPSDIHLNIKVFEKDIDKLYISQKLYANTNARPDKKYLCEIMLISKNITENGISEVHCHFENFDKILIPGLYMNADIEIASNKNYTLPEESIVNFEGKDLVFIDNGKQAYEMFEIMKGNTENGFVEILNADNLSDKNFVTKGAYTILMKMKNTPEGE